MFVDRGIVGIVRGDSVSEDVMAEVGISMVSWNGSGIGNREMGMNVRR